MKPKQQSDPAFLFPKSFCPMLTGADAIGLVLKLGEKNVRDVMYHSQWMSRQPAESRGDEIDRGLAMRPTRQRQGRGYKLGVTGRRNERVSVVAEPARMTSV
jgi:hypothetical protein